MNTESLWLKIIIGIIAVILVTVGGIVVFEAHQYHQKVPESSYYVYGGYSVTDNLKPNLLYNQSALHDPNLIYNSITSGVNFSLFYDIQLNNLSGRDATIMNTVSLVSNNPGWSKVLSVNITNLKDVQRSSKTIPINVNLSADLALANDIDGQLQNGNTPPTLSFNLSIRVAGIPRFNESMNIGLHDTSESLSYGTAQALSSTQFKDELIVPNNVIGLNRAYGYAFIGGAAALAVFYAYLYAPRTTDPVKRIQKEFGDQIVAISTPVGDDATKIEKLEDLLKMSEIFEVPVFLYNADKVLYINHQGYQYYYELI